MTDIMKFIRKERIKQELSQEKLAYAIQVNHATISLWENYRYNPKFEDVERMLNFLGYEIIIKKKVKDEPQTEEWYTYQDEQEYNARHGKE